MLEATCNLESAISHKHTLAPRVLALASTRRGASMFTPTCRCLARWLQSGHVAHVLRLKLPLDQSSSQFAKCWRILLRGLQPRLAGTTTDAYFIAPLAVRRRSVSFWRALGRKRLLQTWEHTNQLCRLPEQMPEMAHPNESALPCQTAHSAIFLSLSKHWHDPQQTVQRLLNDPIDLPHCQDPHQEHDPLHDAVGSLDVRAARVPKWLLGRPTRMASAHEHKRRARHAEPSGCSDHE